MSFDFAAAEDLSDSHPSRSRKSISTASPTPRSLNTNLTINARAITDIMRTITLTIEETPCVLSKK
jgi:hypothetical protein